MISQPLRRLQGAADRDLQSSLSWGANEAEAHGTLARALMRRHGEAARGEAEAALRVSGELIESRGAVTLVPALREWQAELAGLCGDEAERTRLLREARQEYARIGAPLQAERIDLRPSG